MFGKMQTNKLQLDLMFISVNLYNLGFNISNKHDLISRLHFDYSKSYPMNCLHSSIIVLRVIIIIQ